MARGDLFILSAPSGAGKTTLIQSILKRLEASGGLAFSVSHTTRRPRAGEVDGQDYHFVEHDHFQRMIVEDRFLEWAEVHGHYYGTASDEVFPRLERGIDVLMDIDVQGAERVLARYPEAHSIFIMPPGFQALRARLQKRGLDDPQEIARRLAVSLWEIKRYGLYRYVIINENAGRASEALAAIILDKRQRKERMEARVAEILEDFRRAAEGGLPEARS